MNGSVGDPTSRLSAAILRISQSLDLATVLEEAVESARALTGARVGVDDDVRRARTGPGFRHLRPSPGAAPEDGGMARRAAASSSTSGTSRRRSGWRTSPATSAHSASRCPHGARGRCMGPRCTTGASISATFPSVTRRTGRHSPRRTRRSWCFSRRRRRRRSRTRGRTATSSGRGPTSRRSSRPRRSESSSSTPEPAARCRRTERWSRSSNAPGPRRPNAAASSPRRPLGSGPRCRRSANGS